ncbi:MAG: hypothetical protein IME99_02070 [Proteobacteria bacterium]|nr:hypothetical protein [Pseudomonadota bacterium]
MRKVTEDVGAPRSVFLHWPLGHPMGEPGNIEQQTTVLLSALRALVEITVPGTIVDLPFRWRRYEDLSNGFDI